MQYTVLTCTTYDHLHVTLNLIRSIHNTWQSRPRIFVVLVDHLTLDRPGFADLPDVEFLSLEDIEVPNLGWLLCKHTAAEMCFLTKAFALRKLMTRGAEIVCYLDSDIQFFADIQPFAAELGDSDFLVTPHFMSPFPMNEPWIPMTMGGVTKAGVLNAGVFIVRNTPSARAFIDTWGQLCTMPGAFLESLGNQGEQHFFNWVLSFSDKVTLSRNPRINIAYWNLHERPIRWGGLDGRDKETWYLGDEPIICFHFSGFAWDQNRLSRYDHRARPSVNANIFAIGEFYAHRLAEANRSHYSAVPYEFAKVDGLVLDELVLDASARTELKWSEARGTPACASWAAAPAAMRHLNETIAPFNIIPRYLERVLLRTDLRHLIDPIFAPLWHKWAATGLWREHEKVSDIYEKFSPFVFVRDALAGFVENIRKNVPTMDAVEIGRLLRCDRPRLLKMLASCPVLAPTMAAIDAAGYRFPAFVPAVAVRLIYENSPQLKAHFLNIADADSDRFQSWLKSEFDKIYEAPDDVLAFVASFDFERSVARILGKVLRVPHLVEEIRRDGFRREYLTSLIGLSQGGYGYDANDIVVFDWWLDLLGSDVHRRIAELLPPEAGQPRFRNYLAAWCRGRGIVASSEAPAVAARVSEALDRFLSHVQADEHSGAGSPGSDRQFEAFSNRIRSGGESLRLADAEVEAKLRRALDPEPRGINVFGYFKSPIGLGAVADGLCKSFAVAGYTPKKLVIPSDAMDADFATADLFQDFAFNYPRNLVVSYPHIDYQLQAVRPRCLFAGRETIGYFAWEQRDFPVMWRERLAPYDKLCALSRFAADSISRGVGRPVEVLPCTVEVGEPVAKDVARARFGIPLGKFVIGYIFDAASSIERKNPWAVIDAVANAFGHSDEVILVLKVGSGERPDLAPRTAEIRRRAARICGGAMLITDYLPKRDVEMLMCAFDVYVSLHRSEGFGYTLAEAMLLGVPTVASRYSGNLDFMNDENSYLIDCKEIVVTKREGPFETGTVWGNPDIDHAVETLRRIRANYPEAVARTHRSFASLNDTVSPAGVAKAITRILEAQ